MGYIKDPPGVDFVIEPHSYTHEDAAIVSAYIQEQKAKAAKKADVVKKRTAKRKEAVDKRSHK